MTTKRPPSQLTLDLPIPGRGEASRQFVREVEVVTAMTEPESPASTKHLMEAICDPDNIEAALRAVVRNKGAPGVDGMTVRQLPGILKARWPEIEHQLLQGRYQPQPVRRVQIPNRPAGHATSVTVAFARMITSPFVTVWPETDCRPGSESHACCHRPGALCMLQPGLDVLSRRARRIAGGQMVNPVRQLSPRRSRTCCCRVITGGIGSLQHQCDPPVCLDGPLRRPRHGRDHAHSSVAPDWRSVSFTARWRGRPVQLRMAGDTVRVAISDGDAVQIRVGGETHTMQGGSTLEVCCNPRIMGQE